MEEKIDLYNLYDGINTLAVRWLTYQQRTTCKTLGIHNFKSNNITHLWFLHMLENYRVFNDYNVYYIDCSFLKYIYIRFIKKFKGARRENKKDSFMIDVDIFINELLDAFKERIPNIKPTIIEEIYYKYWGE